MDPTEIPNLNEDVPGYSPDGIPLLEGQVFQPEEPLFIAPPPDKSEQAVLDIDQGIDTCISALEGIERSISYLKAKLEHPDQLQALNEMQNVIDEALAPYLEELANHYTHLTDM